MDIWGVSLTADHERKLLYLVGGETNRTLYVFSVIDQAWTVGPSAVYDGGWGASIEWVADAQSLYQIDGRTTLGNEQGSAVLRAHLPGDYDHDLDRDLDDFAEWHTCFSGPREADGFTTPSHPCRGTFDDDFDTDIDMRDLQKFLNRFLDP